MDTRLQAAQRSSEPPTHLPLLMLQEVSRAVNSSLILDDIFDALGEVLQRHIPFQEAVIVILDNTQNGIQMRVHMSEEGLVDISNEGNAFAGYDPLMEAVLKDPLPRRLTGVDHIPQSSLVAAKTQVLLVVPLINKGVVIGLIAAMRSQTPDALTAEHLALLTQTAEPLAVAVENAKLYWQTQSQASRAFLVNRLTTAIRESLEMETILATAVEELGKVIGASRCSIRYFGQYFGAETAAPDTGELPRTDYQSFHYQVPGIPPLRKESDAEEDSTLERDIFERRQAMNPGQALNPFVLNDTRDCPAQFGSPAFFERYQIKSLAIVPIQLQDRLVGTLTLHQCDTFRPWLGEDIDLLQTIAEHVGVALHQSQLFAELAAQKKALEDALTELQQAQMHLIQSEKMAVLGQFVAGIAHEVNTPLGTMMSNNATLTRCVEKLSITPNQTPDPQMIETMTKLLDLNKLASDRIQSIVKNLRNFARLDESELKLVDVREGIESTLQLIEASLPRPALFQKEYGTEVPPIQCYPGLLNQVFMNMIVNALHAMEERPTRTLTIKTDYQPATDQVVVSFEDTGKGIEPEHISKIFDPGFTTKGVGVGTGLGLALCYRIVEKHHGRITVDSTLGVGSRFQVFLPREIAKAP